MNSTSLVKGPWGSTLNRHLHTVVEVRELAAISRLLESQFRRKFKQVFRLSPVQFLLQLRILKAGSLLRSGSLTIGEVSDRCGFESQNYFARYFRQQMGSTPRDYRKRYLR
jgi:AraC-like DNA-binding protein